MKTRLTILLVLVMALCLLAGHAAAAGRYEAFSNGGIVLGPGEPAITSSYNGASILSVPIDNEATDWNAVMLNGGNYDLQVKMQPPAPPAAGYYCVGAGAYMGGATYFDDEMQKQIAREEADKSSSLPHISTNFPAMEPDSTGMVLIPAVCDPSLGYQYEQVCWRFTNGTDVKYVYERYFFTAKHSSSEPITLNARYVSADWQKPMENAYGVASAQRENGTLTLYLDENVNYGMHFEIALELSGPADASTAEIVVQINEEKRSFRGGRTVDGTFRFSRRNNEQEEPLLLACQPTGSVQSYPACMVKWYGKDRKVLDYGTLNIYTVPKEHKPFTDYLAENPQYTDWYPLATSQMKVDNNMKNCGIQTTLSAGHISVEPSGKTPSGNPGEIAYEINPPTVDANGNPITEKITWVRIHSAGSGDSYGRGKEGPMIDESYFLPSPKEVNNNGKVDLGADHPVVRYKAKSVDVYLQQNYDPWGAGIWLINWYTGSEKPSGDTRPVSSQYLVIETAQLFDFEREDPVALVDRESDITSPVQYTMLVKPASMASGLDGWRLVARVDLQNGVDAYHRELYTINDTGAKNKLTLAKGETMVLYMPYPEGFAYGTEQVFTLYHYATSNYKDEPETLTGTNTPYGIRYEVSSLSPFVHSWAKVEEPVVTPTAAPAGTPDVPAVPPKAGDNTPVVLLAWLAAMAVCAMSLLVGQKKRL